ncbi:unnamed protein product [Schistosoma turkestanicum]|nr:unnamed protein product [Schistosoma turkestanicum]
MITFTLYITLVYTVLSVYSDILPFTDPENIFGKFPPQAHPKFIFPFLTYDDQRANMPKKPTTPAHNDELPDFPLKKLNEEQRPLRKLLEILNSGPALPMPLVSPIYYLFEVIIRTIKSL